MKIKFTILLAALSLGLVLTGCETNGNQQQQPRQQQPGHSH